MLIYTKLPASYAGALNNYNTWSIQAGTHEGVAGKGLHVINSSYAYRCFFYKETLGYTISRQPKSSMLMSMLNLLKSSILMSSLLLEGPAVIGYGLLRCPCHFLSFFLRHVSCLLTYEFVYIVTYVYIVMYPMSGESNKLKLKLPHIYNIKMRYTSSWACSYIPKYIV
jgi:hypothetical protein